MTDLQMIDLLRPLPGFPDPRRFALVQLDESGILYQLRSLDDPSLVWRSCPPTT
jgi:flagellar assembly factor FliW